jgi:hypothetical protein
MCQLDIQDVKDENMGHYHVYKADNNLLIKTHRISEFSNKTLINQNSKCQKFIIDFPSI